MLIVAPTDKLCIHKFQNGIVISELQPVMVVGFLKVRYNLIHSSWLQSPLLKDNKFINLLRYRPIASQEENRKMTWAAQHFGIPVIVQREGSATRVIHIGIKDNTFEIVGFVFQPVPCLGKYWSKSFVFWQKNSV